MKKVLLIISLALILVKCTDEDRIRIPEVPGGVNLRIIVDPMHNGIFTDKIATDYLGFDMYSSNKDLSLVELYATKSGEKKLMKSFTQSDFDANQGKLRVELRAADFATAFGDPGLGNGTKVGNFTFNPLVKLNDGRIYPAYVKLSAKDSFLNLAPSINGAAASSFTLAFNSFITCPPVDISGDYEVIEARGKSTDGCCPKEVILKGNTVKITRLTASTFKLSDLTGGLYFDWYDVYGITKPDDSPGEIAFSCNEVFIQNSPEPFGDKFAGKGLFNAEDKSIIYDFTNGYGDAGKIILKKKG